jgi:hypothetical protein
MEASMELIFYHTDDNPNTINKTLNQLSKKELHLKASTDIINPRLLFKNDSVDPKVNYMKLLDRFYFVELEFIRSDTLVILNCQLDVLETYKDIILNSQADIIEKSAVSNVKQNDFTQETITKIYKSDTIIPNGTSIIMQTVGEPLENKGGIK